MFLIKDIAKARGREALQLLNMRPIIKGSKERKKREKERIALNTLQITLKKRLHQWQKKKDSIFI